MTASRHEGQFGVKGDPIGYASGLAIRLIFLREIEWAPSIKGLKGIRSIEDRQIKLHDLARRIGGTEHAKPLCAPIQSFYRDITLNEESARRLPIVAACAAPMRGQIHGNVVNCAPMLRVQIPREIRSEWEGEVIITPIVEGPQPLELTCQFTDTMAFFGPGHVAYTLSIIFQADSFPQRGATASIPVFPTVILSILDLARSNESNSARANVRFGFVGDPAGLKALDEFVSHRLDSLANPADGNHEFRMIPGDMSEYCDIFRGFVWPICEENGWADSKRGKENDFANFKKDFVNFKYEHLQSATCEIVQFTEFERLQQYIAEAKEYKANADSFGQGIAGLAQNVIDFADQDTHEVSDSLFAAGNAGGYLHFVNAQSVVRFYRRSRSFDRMQHFIGGDPYFYFTVLAAVYNEYHTNLAVDALPDLKPGKLIGASPIESTMAEVIGRYEIFVKNLRPMIPNLFRYKTEAALFDDILERRGITYRCDTIEKELKRYETIAHDFEGVNLQRSNLLISFSLIVLALWGVFGALATAASVFVALHSDAQAERVREPALEFARGSAEWLIEMAIWAASVGLALAVILTAVILFKAFPLFFRRLGVSRVKRNSKTPEVT